MRCHCIRNCSPAGLKSVREAPRITESLRWSGDDTYVSLEPECQSGVCTRDLPLSKQATITMLTTVVHQGPRQHSNHTTTTLVSGSCVVSVTNHNEGTGNGNIVSVTVISWWRFISCESNVFYDKITGQF